MLRPVLLAFILALCAGVPCSAADPAAPMPSTAEAAFVRSVQADLRKRFPTASEAMNAGYFRYTNEDDTGAVSYANLHWASEDPQHPSQLWYDVRGRLLGADFSVLKTSDDPPRRWGLLPTRWTAIDAHIHYVTVDANGKRRYDLAVMPDPFRTAGGDPEHPTASTLVKLGLVKDVNEVVAIFLFPAIWDVAVWIKPNPFGAFSEKNPLVTPSH